MIDLTKVQAYIDQRWNDDGEKFRVIAATDNANELSCNAINDYCYEGLVLVHDDKRDEYLIGICWDSGVMSDAYALGDPAYEDFFIKLGQIMEGEQL